MPDWRAEIRRRMPDVALERIEELAQHLEDAHGELLAAGTPLAEAEVALLAELDDAVDALRKPAPPPPLVPGGPRRTLLADLGIDVRYAVRTLVQSRSFATITLLSLALGIGANSALFQLLDALRLRSLAVERPIELARVVIGNRADHYGREAGAHPDLTEPIFTRLVTAQQAFTGMAAFVDADIDLAPHGARQPGRILFATGDFFGVLGVGPALGRLFTCADDAPGCAVAVIGHDYWQRALGGAADAVGRAIPLFGRSFTVVGVTARGFTGPEVGRAFDVAVPMCAVPLPRDDPQVYFLTVLGRLAPGWTLDRASAHLAALSPAIMAASVPPWFNPEHAATFRGYRLAARPGATGVSTLRDQYTTPLELLLGIAAAVLLIACANLANLLLARASARERELAVRLALGASRGRLFRQLMTESLLLATLGAALGLVFGRLLSEALVTLLTPRGERLALALAPDGRVLGFAAGLAVATCILFGVLPAVRAARTDVERTLRGGGRPERRRRLGARGLLVGVQVALSFVLLAFALLFARSLHALATLDPGFRDEDVLFVDVSGPGADYPRLVERLRATPGVAAVATTNIVPTSGAAHNLPAVWMGEDERPTSERFVATARVSPGYFDAIGTPLLAGRDFRATDGISEVAIVNQAFVRTFAGGADPVGRRLHTAPGFGDPGHIYTVVGLVADSKYTSLREDFAPVVYLDDSQISSGSILVRGHLRGGELTAAVARTVTEVAPAARYSVDFLDDIVADSLRRDRLVALLASAFGALAALLAAVGVYGVVAYSVARRTHEIGIRMALGADRGRVARMVVGETVRLVVPGLALGILGALWTTDLARSLLYGLAPDDPSTLVVAGAAMATVAVVASVFPARRAARVDPMVVLREE